MTITQRITALMDQQNLTPSDLALRIGRSEDLSITEMEELARELKQALSAQQIGALTLAQCARALGVEVDELIDGASELVIPWRSCQSFEAPAPMKDLPSVTRLEVIDQ